MKTKPIHIGLTGPTGSGKSNVAACLAAHGACVVDADKAARDVVQPGSPCLAELVEAFSPDILNADDSLNRRALAGLAFADAARTEKLTAITHPHILKLCRERAQAAIDAGTAVVVFDAPLLFESGLDGDCDFTVAVLAPAAVRLERIRARDGLTEAEAKQRMAAQPTDDFYRKRADRVLINDGDKAALRRQAEALLSCI